MKIRLSWRTPLCASLRTTMINACLYRDKDLWLTLPKIWVSRRSQPLMRFARHSPCWTRLITSEEFQRYKFSHAYCDDDEWWWWKKGWKICADMDIGTLTCHFTAISVGKFLYTRGGSRTIWGANKVGNLLTVVDRCLDDQWLAQWSTQTCTKTSSSSSRLQYGFTVDGWGLHAKVS